VLDAASVTSDMDLPGYRLHKLSGNLKGHRAVTVSGNWRVTFRFEDANAFDVDLIDYH
jgi:proteic killer suppression protein